MSDMSDISLTDDSDLESRPATIDQILGKDFAASADLEPSEINLTLEKWKSIVEGRELAKEVYPVSVDQLFTLLFTNSKFYMDFHMNRKTFGKFC
jgi:hypothetical protein